MTVKITTNAEMAENPRKTEVVSPTPIAAEIMQHADVKISKVMFTENESSQFLLLGKGRGRCVALWEKNDGLDPFKIISVKNTDVDPNDSCTLTDHRVCVGYADGSLAIFKTTKDDLTLMSRTPSVHDECASRKVCRNGNSVLSASTNGTLKSVDVETGSTRTIFSGQAGVRSICTTFGGNVVMAGDANGQVTAWDLREHNDNTGTASPAIAIEPISTLIPSKKALDAVSALCSHPAQSNLVCCGTDDGVVGLIDARNVRSANITSTYLVAQRGITQVMFHPTCGDTLLVSSNDGSIIRIDASGAPIAIGTRATKDTIWLEGDLVNSLRLEPIRNESVYPIASFDVHSDTIIAASSIGMVSLYQQLPFFPHTNFGRY